LYVQRYLADLDERSFSTTKSNEHLRSFPSSPSPEDVPGALRRGPGSWRINIIREALSLVPLVISVVLIADDYQRRVTAMQIREHFVKAVRQ
jgi:hypothetical protein